MRIRVDADVLADSLGWILPCVPRVPAVPVQAGIFLDADEELTVEAAGYDAAMRSTMRSQALEPGKVLVPGRFLHQLAATLKGGVIELTTTDDGLHLSCGRSNYNLPLFPADEYVRAVFDDVEDLGEVDATAFQGGLGMIAHAVAGPKSPLDVLKGVNIRASREDAKLWLEGADRYRAARTFVPWVGKSFESTPDAGHLADVVKGLRTRLKLGVSAGRLVIADRDRVAVIASYETNKFPKLDGLLREGDRAYEVTFNREDILTALKRLGQLRETNMTPVWLDIRADGVCEIELINSESRRGGIEQIDCVSTADLALSFNPIYLAESIAAHGAVDKVTLSAAAFGVRKAPHVHGDPRITALIMQIRVPGRSDDS